MSKTSLITGASKGLGREWAEAALDRGDRVAATARKVETQEVAGFGRTPLEVATKDYESRLATWNEWQPVAVEAHGA